MNPNADLIAQARANVLARNNPAHAKDIMAGLWDNGTLVKDEIARLLREPPESEGEGE